MENQQIDNIEEALDLIEQQENEIAKEEEKELAVKNDYSIDDIIDITLDSYKEVSEKSDDIYDLFYKPLATREDRTDASKQALIESQRIKNESIANLVALANAKAKLAQAEAKLQSGNVGIVINSQKGEDVGIDLSKLKD